MMKVLSEFEAQLTQTTFQVITHEGESDQLANAIPVFLFLRSCIQMVTYLVATLQSFSVR